MTDILGDIERSRRTVSPRMLPKSRLGPRGRLTLTVLAVVAPTTLYFVFLDKFGVDLIYYDEWAVVGVVHQSLHGSIPWSGLWAQHNENRVLVPNLIYLMLARIFALNSRATIFVNGCLLFASLILILSTFRRSVGRFPGPLPTLALSCIWLSLAGYENSLSAYQIVWYSALLFFAASMLLLSAPRGVTWPELSIAIVLATLASYCVFQGLLVWPALLLAILRREGISVKAATWVLAALAATSLYFYHLNNSGSQFFSYSLDHPLTTVKFTALLVGAVIPDGWRLLGLRELIGVMLVLGGLWALVRSLRSAQRFPIVAVLVSFVLLFDLSIAAGRTYMGLLYATSSRYAMPNLLLIAAIILQFSMEGSFQKFPTKATLTAYRLLAISLVAVIIVTTVAGADAGWRNGTAERVTRQMGAYALVNSRYLNSYLSLVLTDALVYPGPLGELEQYARGTT